MVRFLCRESKRKLQQSKSVDRCSHQPRTWEKPDWSLEFDCWTAGTQLLPLLRKILSLFVAIVSVLLHRGLIQNYGAYYDKVGAGVTGPVQLRSSKNGSTIDLYLQHWTYQVIIDLQFPFFCAWISLFFRNPIHWIAIKGYLHNILTMFSMFIKYLISWICKKQIGLRGEELGLSNGSTSLWVSQPTLPKNKPLMWYKVILVTPRFITKILAPDRRS